MIYQPYTYLIAWTDRNVFYYGVRYSQQIKGKTPEQDLWNDYFTSSKYVKEFREEHGEPDRIEIRKVFQNSNTARNWEHKVLRRLNTEKKEHWLNNHDGSGIIKTNKTHLSESHKRKISKAHKGKSFSETHKAKISRSKKGKSNPKLSTWAKKFYSTPEGKKKQSNRTRSYWSDPNKREEFSDKLKKLYSTPDGRKKQARNLGKSWYTNGISNKLLKPDEEIPPGFTRGKVQKKK